MTRIHLLSAVCATTLLAVSGLQPLKAADELGQRASWSQPTAADVRQQIDAWLGDRQLNELEQVKFEALWPAEQAEMPGTELLEQLAATIGLFDPATLELVNLCRSDSPPRVLPEFAFLGDEETAPLVRNNLRLLYGRWLSQHRLYDESLAQLDGLKPEEVVDPATLLFFQSVGFHRLLDKEQCLPALAKLLENEETLPRRYSRVARLMEADMKPLKVDSLDEIARLMSEVERRLDLGRAGKKVRQQEDDVIAKLDKLIEELEKQAGGGGGAGAGAGSGSGSGSNPSSPMQDSNAGGGTGPGEVDPRKISDRGDWGNLPPKERQEALQNLSKEFPSHFREVIEEYFRKLARDGVED